MEPNETYQTFLREESNLRDAYENRLRRIANLRLILFLVILGSVGYWLFTKDPLAGAAGIAAFVTFLAVAKRHQRLETAHLRYVSGCLVLERGLARLDGRWGEFDDTGAEFAEAAHPFSGDLDIFGSNSLYQWINRAWTPEGRRVVAERLTEVYTGPDTVESRQLAAAELQGMPKFRTGLEAFAHRVSTVAASFEERNPGSNVPGEVKAAPLPIRFGLPLILLAVAVPAYAGHLSWAPATVVLLVNLFFYLAGVKKRLNDGAAIRHFAETLGIYSAACAHIEAQPFQAPQLTGLQASLKTDAAETASEALLRLRDLGGWLEVQQIPLFHFLLNVFFFYDAHWLSRWNQWRKKYSHKTGDWIGAVSAFEALGCAAAVAFDHPNWCKPKISTGEPGVKARAAGHPLIPSDRRVCNDVALEGNGMLLLLTGSNMSGKSTYMRTIGVNLVLANFGAAACAQSFEAASVTVFTAMRSGDNLAQGISAFYAELLRIRNLVEASAQSTVLFLIDEIFHGTNSKDRHDGARIVIDHLRKNGALGVVTTHDLELAERLKGESRTALAHFAETYENGALHFDYRLRDGISQSRNALALMRLVGIENG